MVLPEHALSCFFGRVELPLSDMQLLFQWRWNTFVVMQQHGFRDGIDGGSVKHFGPDINMQPHRAASTTVDAFPSSSNTVISYGVSAASKWLHCFHDPDEN